MVEDEKPLRNALRHKATRYGRLDAPYLVVVGEEPFSPLDLQDHRTAALCGSTAVVVDGPQAGRPVRLPDGSWRRGRTWRYTRVAGVLFLAGLRPWTALEAKPELWLNPAAQLPIPSVCPTGASNASKSLRGRAGSELRHRQSLRSCGSQRVRMSGRALRGLRDPHQVVGHVPDAR